jgi:plastocyanin
MKSSSYLGIVAFLLICLSVGLRAAESPADDKPSSEAAVKIDNFSFSPAVITVKAGTTVRWTNRDDIPHTVTADDKSFKSKVLDTDEQFTYTFSKPGTYKYFCSIHPKMTGSVVVQ